MAVEKWTPGPWGLYYEIDGFRGPERRMGDVGVVGADEVVACIVYFGTGFNSEWKEEARIGRANAYLIAAAPEMYALLSELIDIEGPQPGTQTWANKVIAVLAKARGEIA